MNEQITARECVKALCSAWFERRSMEETIVFLPMMSCLSALVKVNPPTERMRWPIISPRIFRRYRSRLQWESPSFMSSRLVKISAISRSG